MMRIFVFGSNLAGRHGKGAARHALLCHGAIHGVGHGRQGLSYAIPTKDEKLRTLPLKKIRPYVEEFIRYAEYNPHKRFKLTPVGCGLAGYAPEDIAPMFKTAPSNVELPPEFAEVLGHQQAHRPR